MTGVKEVLAKRLLTRLVLAGLSVVASGDCFAQSTFTGTWVVTRLRPAPWPWDPSESISVVSIGSTLSFRADEADLPWTHCFEAKYGVTQTSLHLDCHWSKEQDSYNYDFYVLDRDTAEFEYHHNIYEIVRRSSSRLTP